MRVRREHVSQEMRVERPPHGSTCTCQPNPATVMKIYSNADKVDADRAGLGRNTAGGRGRRAGGRFPAPGPVTLGSLLNARPGARSARLTPLALTIADPWRTCHGYCGPNLPLLNCFPRRLAQACPIAPWFGPRTATYAYLVMLLGADRQSGKRLTNKSPTTDTRWNTDLQGDGAPNWAIHLFIETWHGA